MTPNDNQATRIEAIATRLEGAGRPGLSGKPRSIDLAGAARELRGIAKSLRAGAANAPSSGPLRE